jgi:hypothetical protein
MGNPCLTAVVHVSSLHVSLPFGWQVPPSHPPHTGTIFPISSSTLAATQLAAGLNCRVHFELDCVQRRKVL